MTDSIHLLLAAGLGSVLASLYFAGLWWTVRRLVHARHPAALYFGSLLFRLAIILTGFYVVIVCCDWPPLVACLIGFLCARLGMMRLLGRGTSPQFAAERIRG